MGKRQMKTEAEITAEIEKDFARWEEIARDGCADPSWPDGVNMNLKRNHIIYGYRRLAEVMDRPVQLSMFDAGFDMSAMKPIPPKVPEYFMVKNGKYAEDRIKRFRQWGYNLVFDMKEVR